MYRVRDAVFALAIAEGVMGMRALFALYNPDEPFTEQRLALRYSDAYEELEAEAMREGLIQGHNTPLEVDGLVNAISVANRILDNGPLPNLINLADRDAVIQFLQWWYPEKTTNELTHLFFGE